jgi:hypothetical protein
MNELPELYERTNNLALTQIGQAVDMFLASRDYANSTEPPYSWVLAHRYAVSSIIHAFIALESFVNELGYEIFSNPDSPKYISESSRNLALRRFAASWGKALPVVDKFEFLISEKSLTIEARLLNQLRELNNLRNYLVHGFSFKTMVLLQANDDNTYTEVDREDSIDWKKSFPNTKFNAIDRLSYRDALVALEIVLACLQLQTLAYDTGFAVVSYHKGVRSVLIFKGAGNTNKLFEE